MRRIPLFFSSLVAGLLFPLTGLCQDPAEVSFNHYSLVDIHVRTADELSLLTREGINIDHYRGEIVGSIEVVINQDEIVRLRRTGLPFEVRVEDIGKEVAGRTPPDQAALEESRSLARANGISGFEYGSMGGFYTYAEVVRELDSMRILFPHLITARESIGVSVEGRAIWAVEISDNPGQAEPGEPVAYFDALHHAREPMAMAVLMYYMYWLLENYGTDPEATYLVDNRRMLFVPVVNPDGYVWNQTQFPNGGGSWRKNRSFNAGGSRGVDLNRNYGYQWGYDNLGSSPDPASETYRGPSPFSEPESRAVRDYTTQHRPAIAFSTHSVAGRYLNPYGYKDTVVSYEYYAEFASDFSRQNNYLYGTVSQMLSYNSNGTTRDFLHHDLSCLTWTPEIGGSGFWPNQSEIIPLAQENLLACRYLSWVAGAFADYQAFSFVGSPFALPGDTVRLAVQLRNKGLRLPARAVTVDVASLSPHLTGIVSSAAWDSIAARGSVSNDADPLLFLLSSTAPFLDELKLEVSVRQEGILTSRDTISIIVGYPRVIFYDDAESGVGRWTSTGNGIPWDTSFVMAYTGLRSIADSRYGNVANSTQNYMTISDPIALAGTVHPRLEFFGRWAHQSNSDYVRVQLSTNNGSTWTSLAGRHSRSIGGQPAYTANMGTWAWEHISLQPYVGQSIRLRFMLVTNSSLRGDGFYCDDLRVVDYRDSIVTSAPVVQGIPARTMLFPSFPNPFNPSTTIRYELAVKGRTVLQVYDILGRPVVTLVQEEQEAGSFHVTWNAPDAASGIYFSRLSTPSGNFTRKMLLLK